MQFTQVVSLLLFPSTCRFGLAPTLQLTVLGVSPLEEKQAVQVSCQGKKKKHYCWILW